MFPARKQDFTHFHGFIHSFIYILCLPSEIFCIKADIVACSYAVSNSLGRQGLEKRKVLKRESFIMFSSLGECIAFSTTKLVFVTTWQGSQQRGSGGYGSY